MSFIQYGWSAGSITRQPVSVYAVRRRAATALACSEEASFR